MSYYEYGLFFILSLSTATFDFHPRGWLDKVVEYHKNKLFEDLRKVPTVEIKVTLKSMPRGYVDSPAWDFDSVTRLVLLIRQSKRAIPVRRVLRRMFMDTRRRMSFHESFKHFPSLNEDINNDLYYDTYSGENEDVATEDMFVEDRQDGIIIVSNPVEARLPSAMISVNLLRKILEERAIAARYMPTTKRTIPWKPMNKTKALQPAGQSDNKEDAAAPVTEQPAAKESGADGAEDKGATTTGAAEDTTIPVE